MARIFGAFLDPLKIGFMLIFIEFWGFVLECQNSNKQLKNRANFEHLFGVLLERPQNDV